MKNGKYIMDERVQKIREKIQSEGFKIAVILIAISMMIKQLVFKLPIISAYFDFGIIAILSVYVNVKGIRAGIRVIPDRNGEKGKAKYIRTVLVTFAAAIAVTFILGMINYFALNFSFIESFISLWPLATIVPAVLSLGRILFDRLSSKKTEKNIAE